MNSSEWSVNKRLSNGKGTSEKDSITSSKAKPKPKTRFNIRQAIHDMSNDDVGKKNIFIRGGGDLLTCAI